MQLQAIDWVIIALYVAFALGVGSLFFSKANTSIQSFFVGDRRLPWWLAGTSIVATTFAADTPLAVAGIVAKDGVAGNWIWWCWAIAHLTATFFFARLWRRAGVITDAEVTELRYSGRPAAALRVFKAMYFGLFVNCLTMAWVIAAMVKISGAFFDVDPHVVIVLCVVVSVAYTTLGGFRGVVLTDLVQFTLGMAGAIALAWLAVDAFGGVGALPPESGGDGSGLLGALAETVTKEGREVQDFLAFVPAADHPTLPAVFFITLLFAGWWRYAEGNGYIVQRLAATRDEGQAQGASLWFAVAHNALRPWPWILVGLCALVVYPRLAGDPNEQLEATVGARSVVVSPVSLDVEKGGALTFTSLEGSTHCFARVGEKAAPLVDGTASFETGFSTSAFMPLTVECDDTPRATLGKVRVELLDREMGYPLLMAKYLPAGLLGLVVASLLAAFMSTIDTHTNWGASYLVQDIYRRFLRPNEDERHYVLISRACILLMAVLAGLAALIVHDIASVWRFLITLGAGLGSVTAARWYWSRVTPHAEFAAMAVTTLLAVGFELFGTKTLFGGDNPLFVSSVPGWTKILLVAAGSLATWIPVSLFGPRNDEATLRAFAARVKPPGPGWDGLRDATPDALAPAAGRFALGLVVVFATLFGIGELVLGHAWLGVGELGAAGACLYFILKRGRAAA